MLAGGVAPHPSSLPGFIFFFPDREGDKESGKPGKNRLRQDNCYDHGNQNGHQGIVGGKSCLENLGPMEPAEDHPVEDGMPHEDGYSSGTQDRKGGLSPGNQAHHAEGHENSQAVPGKPHKETMEAKTEIVLHFRIGIGSFQKPVQGEKGLDPEPADQACRQENTGRENLDPDRIHPGENLFRFQIVAHQEKGVKADNSHRYIMVSHQLAVTCNTGQDDGGRNQIGRMYVAKADCNQKENKHSQGIPGRCLIIKEIQTEALPSLRQIFRHGNGKLHDHVNDPIGIDGKIVFPPNGFLGKQAGNKNKNRHMKSIHKKIKAFSQVGRPLEMVNGMADDNKENHNPFDIIPFCNSIGR